MIKNTTRNTVLASKVILADTASKRMVGLLDRSNLDQGEGLVLDPCNSVHMLFMKFAIDVIFLDKNNRVVGLCENLKPFCFSPIFWESACALELPAGTIKQSNTQSGDQITRQS
jgi:uncharacterized protein